jgi:hypothetical protein
VSYQSSGRCAWGWERRARPGLRAPVAELHPATRLACGRLQLDGDSGRGAGTEAAGCTERCGLEASSGASGNAAGQRKRAAQQATRASGAEEQRLAQPSSGSSKARHEKGKAKQRGNTSRQEVAVACMQHGCAWRKATHGRLLSPR